MIALLTIIQDPLPLKTMYFIQRLQKVRQILQERTDSYRLATVSTKTLVKDSI